MVPFSLENGLFWSIPYNMPGNFKACDAEKLGFQAPAQDDGKSADSCRVFPYLYGVHNGVASRRLIGST
jgi:hypothetical protein